MDDGTGSAVLLYLTIFFTSLEVRGAATAAPTNTNTTPNYKQIIFINILIENSLFHTRSEFLTKYIMSGENHRTYMIW